MCRSNISSPLGNYPIQIYIWDTAMLAKNIRGMYTAGVRLAATLLGKQLPSGRASISFALPRLSPTFGMLTMLEFKPHLRRACSCENIGSILESNPLGIHLNQ